MEDPVSCLSRADGRYGSAGQSHALSAAAEQQRLLLGGSRQLPRSVAGAASSGKTDRPATVIQTSHSIFGNFEASLKGELSPFVRAGIRLDLFGSFCPRAPVIGPCNNAIARYGVRS